MNEIQKLERRIHWSECFHLALLTLLLAFPIALLFREDSQTYRALWALGTVIPVQLIRFICERVKKRSVRTLLSLSVFALTMVITWHRFHWTYYLLCCVPILISGLLLPRSKGKLLLTNPTIPSLFAWLPAYAVGKSVGISLVTFLALILTALLILNYHVHTNQTRLLDEIRLPASAGTEVSATSMIRQNRKQLFVYALVGILLLSAIPLLFEKERDELPDLPALESDQAIEVVTEETKANREYRPTGDAKPLHLEAFKDIVTWIVILIPAIGVIVSTIFGIRFLIDLINRRKKPPVEERHEGMSIERLDEEDTTRKRERLTGYEKKIRRRYEKLILRRTEPSARLSALTPTELESCADVSGPGAEIIHEIYRQTRYSSEPATRESYSAFKEAIRTLRPPRTPDAQEQSRN